MSRSLYLKLNSDAMKRRSEAKEVTCDTKAEIDQVQGVKKSKQTLIGAIEQIVNLAVELKLGDAFHEKARPDLAYVAGRMSLNEEQALVFALFMEKSAYSRIHISDFAELVGTA